MAYNEFTLSTIKRQFQLDVQEADQDFVFPPAAISDFLRQTLAENVPLALDVSTEKARSELIVTPVLMEVRRNFPQQMSLFSGVEFNVDIERGLRGVCDFLLSLSPLQLAVEAPVVTIVEAKNDNIKSGLGQCIAEMVAAQMFNREQGNTIPTVYGVVTTGKLWRFLRLNEGNVVVGNLEYVIEDIERVVGILIGMIRTAMESRGTSES